MKSADERHWIKILISKVARVKWKRLSSQFQWSKSCLLSIWNPFFWARVAANKVNILIPSNLVKLRYKSSFLSEVILVHTILVSWYCRIDSAGTHIPIARGTLLCITYSTLQSKVAIWKVLKTVFTDVQVGRDIVHSCKISRESALIQVEHYWVWNSLLSVENLSNQQLSTCFLVLFSQR